MEGFRRVLTLNSGIFVHQDRFVMRKKDTQKRQLPCLVANAWPAGQKMTMSGFLRPVQRQDLMVMAQDLTLKLRPVTVKPAEGLQVRVWFLLFPAVHVFVINADQ